MILSRTAAGGQAATRRMTKLSLGHQSVCGHSCTMQEYGENKKAPNVSSFGEGLAWSLTFPYLFFLRLVNK